MKPNNNCAAECQNLMVWLRFIGNTRSPRRPAPPRDDVFSIKLDVTQVARRVTAKRRCQMAFGGCGHSRWSSRDGGGMSATFNVPIAGYVGYEAFGCFSWGVSV